MRFVMLGSAALASTALTACAHNYTPPAIAYDAPAVAAVKAPEPPRAVQIVTVPQPLPLPGQLKLVPSTVPAAPPEPADPRARVEAANGAARVQPSRSGYLNAVQVYPFRSFAA